MGLGDILHAAEDDLRGWCRDMLHIEPPPEIEVALLVMRAAQMLVDAAPHENEHVIALKNALTRLPLNELRLLVATAASESEH